MQCSDALETLTNVKATAQKALDSSNENKTLIGSLSAKVDHLTDAVDFLMSENNRQKEHILRNETYSRRNNLVFRGYNIVPNDQESCEMKARGIIKQMGIPERVPFVRCHYLRDQKQIIIRFQWYSDRERIWKNRYKLKGTSYYVAEDFPREIEAQRKQLYPVMKAAKRLQEYQKKVSMNCEKLILKGKQYTCNTIDTVPLNIHPGTLAERSNARVLVFGGTTSKHHGLSNFSQIKTNFVYEHIAYSSAEQAFQHKKARQAGDQNKQREIMFNSDPAVQKSLGYDVNGLDQEQWKQDRRGYMKDILIAKFTQIDHLKRQLLDTGERTLAEANGRDHYFGIGLPLTHPDVLDPNKWSKDGNQLGLILMEIRQELSK